MFLWGHTKQKLKSSNLTQLELGKKLLVKVRLFEQVYFAKNTYNLLIHLAIKSVHLHFSPYITIVCSCE